MLNRNKFPSHIGDLFVSRHLDVDVLDLQYQMADNCLKRIKVDPPLAKVAAFFTQADNDDKSFASYLEFVASKSQEGDEADFLKALSLYLDSAKKGHQAARLAIADLYIFIGEFDLAVNTYLLGVENSCAIACMNLAKLYEKMDQKNNAGRIITLYQRAASWGIAEAQLALGHAYSKSPLVMQDLAKAQEYYEMCEATCGEAKLGLARIRLNTHGLDNKESNLQIAEGLIESVALGNVQATICLGLLYEHGISIEQSLDDAIRLYRKAIYRGSFKAYQHLIGLYYRQGEFEKMSKTCHEASTRGYPEAEYMMGCLYYSGIGLATDVKRSFEMFYIAAAGDHLEAQKNARIMLFNGIGAKQNTSRALSSFSRKELDDLPLEGASISLCMPKIDTSLLEVSGVCSPWV